MNLVGAHTPTTRELDSEGIRRSVVYVDCLAAALAESGDILLPIQEGLVGKGHIRGEVGQVILGQAPGRQNDQDITLFKSLGHAVEDLVAGDEVWRTLAPRDRPD